MSKILAIHAHPDDIEMLAGGTLALLAERGHSITMVTMAPGDCGTAELPPEEIAAIRRREAAESAALIGARYRCAEFRDFAIYSDDASRRRVVEILRQAKPDLVLTASPTDYMCDHETTSLLVRDACFGAPLRNYVTGVEEPAPPMASIPHLYFMNPIAGVDREAYPVIPEIFVNVESTFEKKKRMLSCHRSQRDWLLRHHGMDNYLKEMERWTRECGAHAGLTLAEGFRRYKGHPYPQSPLLEELVGGQGLGARG